MSRYGAWRMTNKAILDGFVHDATGKPNKYGAKRTTVDGISFDSKREAARYSELKLMQSADLIHDLEVHPRFPIDYYGVDGDDSKIHICDVELDFRYWLKDSDNPIDEDVKGKDNPLSALKRKLVEAFYGIKVSLIR